MDNLSSVKLRNTESQEVITDTEHSSILFPGTEKMDPYHQNHKGRIFYYDIKNRQTQGTFSFRMIA